MSHPYMGRTTVLPDYQNKSTADINITNNYYYGFGVKLLLTGAVCIPTVKIASRLTVLQATNINIIHHGTH